MSFSYVDVGEGMRSIVDPRKLALARPCACSSLIEMSMGISMATSWWASLVGLLRSLQGVTMPRFYRPPEVRFWKA
ncbi:hypothetical protein ATN89_18910 [Comamonas thiooxydans]|nr:hypothetical protein ATN89_18910 [Comamonas thiooxydans]